MPIAIHVENLSKCYTIAHQQASKDSQSLSTVLERGLRKFGSRMFRRGSNQKNIPHDSDSVISEDFYALRDISFEVKTGERVGIIGANGAGKSTLLKILSRITEPTSGRICIRGRVSSLLEVGTGFHPELTGRENIYLNGAILGMPRSEIHKKFDEIVAFSEVERFLDTPVKHYSSGMYVRLAFSVAAHLDPEVLILDEVLAVGDARFQKKCMNQMRRFSDEGRTVLFVSHSASAISQFCSTAISLENGAIKKIGPAQDVVDEYMLLSSVGIESVKPELVSRSRPGLGQGDELLEINEIVLNAEEFGEVKSIPIGYDITVRMTYTVKKMRDNQLIPNFHVRTFDGTTICVLAPPNSSVAVQKPGQYYAECLIPKHVLNEGIYTVQVAVTSLNKGQVVHANISQALVFEICDDLSDLSWRHGFRGSVPGLIRPRWNWRIGDYE